MSQEPASKSEVQREAQPQPRQEDRSREYNDRPPREYNDRPPREYNDRPPREYNDRPPREYNDRPPREYNDRPPREYNDRPPRDEVPIPDVPPFRVYATPPSLPRSTSLATVALCAINTEFPSHFVAYQLHWQDPQGDH
jgi:hypothetical protein